MLFFKNLIVIIEVFIDVGLQIYYLILIFILLPILIYYKVNIIQTTPFFTQIILEWFFSEQLNNSEVHNQFLLNFYNIYELLTFSFIIKY